MEIEDEKIPEKKTIEMVEKSNKIKRSEYIPFSEVIKKLERLCNEQILD